MIEVSAFEIAPLCRGYIWEISNKSALVERVGELMLGQYRHVNKVLRGVGTPLLRMSQSEISSVIEKLKVDTDKQRELRDGWVFQLISWLAASTANPGRALLSRPHMGTARKGFDGVMLLLTAGNEVERVYFCEDKAGENARTLVRKALIEIRDELEPRKRDSELRDEVTGILERHYSDAQVDKRIEDAIWKEGVRAYRVAAAVAETHCDDDGRRRLFKDYETCAPGQVLRRRGETVRLDDLRGWMDDFCEAVADYLERLKDDDV